MKKLGLTLVMAMMAVMLVAGGAAFGSLSEQDIDAFDSYTLSIQNSNENPWMYAL